MATQWLRHHFAPLEKGKDGFQSRVEMGSIVGEEDGVTCWLSYSTGIDGVMTKQLYRGRDFWTNKSAWKDVKPFKGWGPEDHRGDGKSKKSRAKAYRIALEEMCKVHTAESKRQSELKEETANTIDISAVFDKWQYPTSDLSDQEIRYIQTVIQDNIGA